MIAYPSVTITRQPSAARITHNRDFQPGFLFEAPDRRRIGAIAHNRPTSPSVVTSGSAFSLSVALVEAKLLLARVARSICKAAAISADDQITPQNARNRQVAAQTQP